MKHIKEIYTLGYEEGQVKKLLSLLLAGQSYPNLYFIMLGTSKEEALVIYPSWMLTISEIEQEILIGFADGKQKALQLVESIISEIYETTLGLEILEYFSDK